MTDNVKKFLEELASLTKVAQAEAAEDCSIEITKQVSFADNGVEVVVAFDADKTVSGITINTPDDELVLEDEEAVAFLHIMTHVMPRMREGA